MRLKNFFIYVRNLSRAKRIAFGLAAVFTIAILSTVLWLNSIYPSDDDLYSNFLDGKSPSADQRDFIPLISKGRITLTPPMTHTAQESLSVLEASGYLKKNPYTTNPLVRRYATGTVGDWLDEKNSLVLPEGHELVCDAEIPSDSEISFDAVATSFVRNDTEKTLEIYIERNGSRTRILSRKIAPYERDTFERSQKPVDSGFPAIYAATGWENFKAGLPKAKGKTRLVIRYSGKNPDKSIAFISNLNASYSGPKKYNVIHILFDAMSQNYMGIYNPDSTLTPNFDRLKDEFVVLDRMYSLGTKTRISVGGFLTSSLPPETRHGYNYNVIPDFEKEQFYHDSGMTTLPRVMAANGYHTLQVGNCGFTNPILPTAIDYGFDESFEFQKIPYDSAGIVFHMMQSLRKNKDKPFYCYVHLNTTHKPRITPVKFYLKGYLDMPSHAWRPNVTGATAYADDLFAKLVEYLKKEGLWENTIVIISSDHGTLYHSSNWGRNNLLEDFVRIPFLVHLPSELRAKLGNEARTGEATSLINLAPTVIDLAGIKPEKRFRGRSIVPILGPHTARIFTDSRIFSYDTFGYSMILDGRWKYTLLENETESDSDYRRRNFFFFFGNGYADAGESLIDLVHDPLEITNLEVAQPLITKKIRAILLATPRHPFLTMFAVYPGNDPVPSKITVHSSGKILRAELSSSNAKDSVTFSGSDCTIRIAAGPETRKIAIETVPANASLKYTVERNGKIVPSGQVLFGEYLFPLFPNPGTIATDSDRRALESTLNYPGTFLVRKPDHFLVHISRIDIRYWQRESSKDESGADTNMKEVLKSWGYIQ